MLTFWRARAAKSRLQIRLQFICPQQVTAHVGADAHIDSGRRRQVKVRIEAGDRMNPAQWSVERDRQSLQLFRRQIAEFTLDGSQLVEHGGALRSPGFRTTLESDDG